MNLFFKSRAGIDQLSDGFVGKLQLLKSGRCRLKLGGLSFDVKMGTPATFAQVPTNLLNPFLRVLIKTYFKRTGVGFYSGSAG